MQVPFIPDARLERAADRLLDEFRNGYGWAESLPIPVEDILEKHLKLTLEITDLQTKRNDPYTLGAIEFGQGIVQVDLRLDPDTFPNQIGRYHFTLGHEIGHWVLHKDCYLGNPHQLRLLEGELEPDIVCRDIESEDKQKIIMNPQEIQANKFAAFLLMPRRFVLDTWCKVYPNVSAFSVADFREESGDVLSSDDELLAVRARPLAKTFSVSTLAMRIRLEQLQLLRRTDQVSLL